MIVFNAEVKGLDKVLQHLNQLPKEIGDEIDKDLSKVAKGIATSAASYAPKGKTGALSRSVSADVSTRFKKTVTVSAPYAAYVEFGTGSEVFKGNFQFTPEMKEYAANFIVNGQGRLPAQPYLFPAYQMWVKVLIETLFTKLTQKFSVSRNINSGRL